MKNEKISYFIDYSEDGILPSGGDAELVARYAMAMERLDKGIAVYDLKEDMYTDALEWASQARDGCGKYISFTDDEMKEKIKKADREFEKRQKRVKMMGFG